MPFYVSPEQQMKDRSDFARKGIARGRSVLVMTYADGILFVGENPSKALHKVSEIYDRIAFAAVGKYNEFENLRLAGVRYADLRGYQYDRSDVTSRGLANAYAQTLGTVFTESGKPYEVEVVVAEIGKAADDDQLYRLTYDGSVAEEHQHVVMGGQSEPIAAVLREEHRPELSLQDAVRLGVRALSQTGPDTEPRTLVAGSLEAAVLDRGRPRRAFRRLQPPQLAQWLGIEDDTAAAPAAGTADPSAEPTDGEPGSAFAGGPATPSTDPTSGGTT